jgi:uncharacterized protein
MQFVGRTRELKALEDAFQSHDSSFMPIYGRRRVGKSELIKHFIKDKKALYFLGKQAPAKMQLREFLHSGSLTFDQPLLERASVDDWRQAISLVIEQVPVDEKIVLVMDEFQWVVEACPELPSVLQSFIDNGWEGGCKVFLILCGSYMGFMERKVLGEKSPLFGRRAGQILLRPFSYLEAGRFHPSWSETDKAKVFSICGGIPYYLNFFSPADSIDANICNNFLNEFSALAREPEFLLREELKELKQYFGILTALSTGAVTNREMARATGVDERALFYYLNTLIELGYIMKHYPLTGAKANPKQVRYKLHDPLLRFWFRFIYPNGSAIYQMDQKSAFSNLIKPHLDSYFGTGYETLCREALSRLYQREELTCAYKIGEYWDKDIQIDIVGYRQDGVIDICECKWGKISSIPQLLKELNTKISRYPNKDNKTIHGRLFLRSRTKKLSSHSIQTHFLSDLYRLD